MADRPSLRRTRSPWLVGFLKHGRSLDPRCNVWGPAAPGHRRGHRIAKDVTPADAALIAAAPDLLDACRRLLKFNEELCGEVNVSTHYPSADCARAAIAKAEGGA